MLEAKVVSVQVRQADIYEYDHVAAAGVDLDIRADISMQGAADSRKSQKDNGLSFPILTDKNGELAAKLGIRWTLQDYVIPVHDGIGVHMPRIHGDGQWNLPMPARYVIDLDSNIVYAEVNPDYTRRPVPSSR